MTPFDVLLERLKWAREHEVGVIWCPYCGNLQEEGEPFCCNDMYEATVKIQEMQ